MELAKFGSNKYPTSAFLSLLVFAVASCSSFLNPIAVSVGTSNFDHRKYVKLTPTVLNLSTSAAIGLYRIESMKKKEVQLTLELPGAVLIDPGNSLQFNIDGQFYELSAIDELTHIETGLGGNRSSKQYLIDTDLLRKMADARSIVARVYTDREFQDISLSRVYGTVLPQIRRFLEHLEASGI